MTPERPVLERRVLAALEATPARVPVLLGGCGSGRSSVLLRLRDLVGRGVSQYIDVERVATTPERFLQSLVSSSPFPPPLPRGSAEVSAGSARDAFDAALAFLSTARASAGAATFLLDEALELRTFESFPGLRSALRDLVDALSASPNRFVLTTRYVARAHRLLRDAPPHFEVIHVPPLTRSEIAAAMARGATEPPADRDELARAIHALADGRPAYVAALTDALGQMERRGGGDAVSALAAQIAPGGRIETACRFCYELRLHRARGYGALKAILEVLADEEPLTLTEIAIRLRRTPGSCRMAWVIDWMSRRVSGLKTPPGWSRMTPTAMGSVTPNDSSTSRSRARAGWSGGMKASGLVSRFSVSRRGRRARARRTAAARTLPGCEVMN